MQTYINKKPFLFKIGDWVKKGDMFKDKDDNYIIVLRYYKDNLWNKIFNKKKIGWCRVKLIG